ncbi:MAG TPA: ABC transporter permease [Streptosporangiaceae bacterium]|nr:ABC transporter permease [Streptosporangiaceae bacterium]
MKYVLRRLGFFVVTLWACLTINFVLPRLMPGNPAIAMMARFRGRVNGSVLQALEIAFGVNTKQSEISQYFTYLRNTFTGHFGVSLTFFPETVVQVVRSAILWTLGLVGLTTVLAFLLGTLIGMISGWRRGSKIDSILPPIFVITSAFPYFFVALLSLLLFSITWHWLPSGFGYSNTDTIGWTWSYISDVLQHAVLPAFTILVTSIGGWILTMRNNMISTLAEDYVRMAQGKGLSPVRVMLDYAGRNAILPNLTGFAMSLGFVVSGAILVEYVFSYPGLGYMLLDGVQNEDYALMQTLFLLITVAVLLAVLAVDFVTMALDPRTRSQA